MQSQVFNLGLIYARVQEDQDGLTRARFMIPRALPGHRLDPFDHGKKPVAAAGA